MMVELTIAGILKIRAILGREHPRKKIDDAYRWRGGGVVSNMFLRLFEVTKFNEGLVLG